MKDKDVAQGKSALFQSVGKSYVYGHTQCNGFKQVQIAYLAPISYLDKLVQPSYTLSTQIRSPLATPQVCLEMLDALTLSGNADYATAVVVN